jgi:hypothetical protein
LQNFFHWYIIQSWKLRRSQIQLRPHNVWTYTSNSTTVVNSVLTNWLKIFFTFLLTSLSLYIFTKIHRLLSSLQRRNRNESGRLGALKSDSTHHSFRNACTKSGPLRFSQFSSCWLILSLYIIMSVDFPFVRLFGNFVITFITFPIRLQTLYKRLKM